MSPDEKNLSFRILVLIVEPKLAKQAEKMFQDGAVPALYRLYAKGTASSEMMDILGLGSIAKTMLFSMMPTPFAKEILGKFKKELRLGSVGSGIAFTMPLSGVNHLILRMIRQIGKEPPVQPERKEEPMADIKYALIAAIINQGYSDEAVAAARAAGAKGGTVLHSRRVGNEQVSNFWGLSVQEEKEIVLIVADVDGKLEIMKAISEKCGIRSEAGGSRYGSPDRSCNWFGRSLNSFCGRKLSRQTEQ